MSIFKSKNHIKSAVLLASIFTMSILAAGCVTKTPFVNHSVFKKSPESKTLPVLPTKSENAHTAQNSLDWSGYYTGTTPCADCSGIDVWLNLQPTTTQNVRYMLSYHYQEKPVGDYQISGEGIWRNNGSVINLQNKDENRELFIGENYAEFLVPNQDKTSNYPKSIFYKVNSFTDSKNILLIDPTKVSKKPNAKKNIIKMPVLLNELSSTANPYKSLTAQLSINCSTYKHEMTQIKYYSRLFGNGNSLKKINRKTTHWQTDTNNSVITQAIQYYCNKRTI